MPTGLRRDRFPAMGTEVLVLAPGPSAEAASRIVRGLVEAWEATLSRFRPDSELTRLNARPGRPVRVSALLFTALERALAAARETGGLYDPTLGRRLEELGYDRSFELLPEVAAPDVPPAWSRAAPGGRWPSTASGDRGGPARGGASTWAGSPRAWPSTPPWPRCAGPGWPRRSSARGGDLAVFGRPPGRPGWPVAVEGVDGPPVVGGPRRPGHVEREPGGAGARATPSATTCSTPAPAARRRAACAR